MPLLVTAVCISTGMILLPVAGFAASPSILVEQKSEIGATGVWTVSLPNQLSIQRNDISYTITDTLPGRHTVFVVPPEGTNTSIELYENGALTQTVTHPQISFSASEDVQYRLVISYTLVNFGKVGVNSTPSGIPFQLTGPDGMFEKGVTPASFDRMPVGSYSVLYKPKGCAVPPAKSDVLEKEKGVYFSVTLRCETFVPTKDESVSEHVQVTVEGQSVTYLDVAVDTWFGPYVATVSDRGILTGYRDGSGKLTGQFGPENPVTLAELAKIMHQLGEIDQNAIGATPRNRSALGKWFTQFVSSAEERGWSIYQNDQADLLRPATRGEVLVTLLQVLDIPLTWPKGSMFTDVTLRTPFAHAIETAATAGIVAGSTGADGKPDGFFHPTDLVTRAEMAKIVIIVQEKYKQKFNQN